jgi:3-oxoacyl-[acyl-carrier protein] reductase
MKQRWALITGTSKGLGAALARRFWDAGYSVGMVARTEEQLRRVAESFSSNTNQRVQFFARDFSDPSSPEDLARQVRSHLPCLDVLVNNAAIQGPIGPVWTNDMHEWTETLQVNLLAPVVLCRAFVPWMREYGGGSIINLSGGGATGPRANFSAYAAAKTALVRFSETLAEEVRDFGIRVNCIAPGAMRTAMLEQVLGKGASAAGDREYAVASEVLSKGGASMEKVADLALFLASDASKEVTGKLISAVWDNWQQWNKHFEELGASDAYTLRRITGRDRGFGWGDL